MIEQAKNEIQTIMNWIDAEDGYKQFAYSCPDVIAQHPLTDQILHHFHTGSGLMKAHRRHGKTTCCALYAIYAAAFLQQRVVIMCGQYAIAVGEMSRTVCLLLDAMTHMGGIFKESEAFLDRTFSFMGGTITIVGTTERRYMAVTQLSPNTRIVGFQ